MSFKVGDQVIITELLKIRLADATPVNIPRGTLGIIESRARGNSLRELRRILASTLLTILHLYPEEEQANRAVPPCSEP
jgi:hypothetical protein